MKHRLSILLRPVLEMALLATVGITHATPPTLPAGQYWKLVFEDDFNTAEFDTTKWTSGFGDRDNLGSSAPSKKNISVKGGNLILSATQEPIGGKPNSVGCVNTRGKFEFKQGYVEFKMKAPKGNGFTTLVSLISHTQILYMNMLENPARIPNTTLTVLYMAPKIELRWNSPTPFPDSWREYGWEWNDKSVVGYIDGVERTRDNQNASRHYDNPAYLSLQLFVGDGGYAGAADNTTPWPGTQEFEYVRIYQITDQKPAPILQNSKGLGLSVTPLRKSRGLAPSGVTFVLPGKIGEPKRNLEFPPFDAKGQSKSP